MDELGNDQKDLFRAILGFETSQESLDVIIPCGDLLNKVAQVLPYDGINEDEREWNIEWICSILPSIIIKRQGENGWNMFCPFVSVNYLEDADNFIIRYNEATLKTKEQLLAELELKDIK